MSGILVLLVATSGLLAIDAEPAAASHFRFRNLSWERLAGGTNEVRFTLRTADRRSFYGIPGPSVGTAWQESIDFGDGQSGVLHGHVVSVNAIDDWFIAEVTGTHAYASAGPWNVDWQSCCTLSTLRNSPDSPLRARTVVNLAGNAASPSVSISPIVNVPSGGGVRTVKVPALDPDSSQLSFRLATTQEAIVTQPTGLSVNSSTGVLSWDTTGLQDGLWIATVVTSDGQGAATQTTFLLNLGARGGGAPPTWIAPTPPDRKVFDPRGTTTFTVSASDPEGEPVTINHLGLPPGLTCTNVANPAPVARVDCTLTPARSQFDLVTFDAQDAQGNSAGVRNYTIGGGRYVSLGDSFQSGEGAGDYEPSTDVDDVNECHRSRRSYPYLVAATSGAPKYATHVACSGATIAVLSDKSNSTDGPPWNEGAQLDNLGPDVTLATLGIGGNDAGFTDTLKYCTLLPCLKAKDQPTRALIKALDTPDANGLTRLERLYLDIRKRAPRAKLLVVGYPRFFKRAGNRIGCQFVFPGDQRWINEMVTLMNDTVERNARRVGAQFVDVEEAFEGHTLCEGNPFTKEYVNGITPSQTEHSFHPNEDGHAELAKYVVDVISKPLGDGSFNVLPGQSVRTTRVVPAGSASASFFTRWPGSDVTMSLRSPSGRIVGRDTTASDVFHEAGPTTELYRIKAPEPGTWTVTLFGTDVGADGEETWLSVQSIAPANAAPTAKAAHVLNGATVTVRDDGSFDPDGSIASYEWDFGDGTSATGRVATHTYTVAGTFHPTLVVTDNGGYKGFDVAAPVTVNPVKYVFKGFEPPLAKAPAAHQAKAGSTLPLKWRITHPDGKPVTQASSFVKVVSQRVACATGATTGPEQQALSTTGIVNRGDGSWQYDWKTLKAYAGTCRRVTVVLADGTTGGRQATVRFR